MAEAGRGPGEGPALELEGVGTLCARVRHLLQGVLIGQAEVVDWLLTALLAGGHVLLEGPPGVGKTLAVRALAAAVGGSFARVQCVPDLLPGDVTGSSVFNRATGAFEIRRGPLFAHLVLLDELNRTTPRTQAAVLEAMAEGQVTIDGASLPLPMPHMVVATQNPQDVEGTYPLPINARDRFLLLVRVGYPAPEAERALLAAAGPVGLERLAEGRPEPADPAPQDPAAWVAAVQAVRATVRVADSLVDYVYRLLAATRAHPDLELGVSPRGGVQLLRAARAVAAQRGRDYVVPDDVKACWLPVARHRIRPQPEIELAGFDAEALLRRIADETPVPR